MSAASNASGLARYAARFHRLSGLALALFLPVHFFVLGLALERDNSFEAFFEWSQQPLVKISEWLLLMALVVHLTLGVRIVLIELGRWRGARHTLIVVAALLSGAVGGVFLWLSR